MNFVNLVAHGPTMENPNKRAVKKLRYDKSIH